MNKLARYIIIIAVAAMILFFAWYFSNILIYILIAGVLSMIGRPLVDLFGKIKIGKIRLPHWLCAGLALLAICFIAFLFFYTILPLVGSLFKDMSNINVAELVSHLSEPFHNIEQQIQDNIPGGETFSIKEVLIDKITPLLNFANLTIFFGSIANMIINLGVAIFCIFFITFFFLKEDNLFSTGVVLLFPKKYEANATRAMQSINVLLIRYFVGIFCEILCVMSILTIILTLFVGINFSTAIVIALFAGILNVIPYVGPLVGGILGVFIALTTDANFIATGSLDIVIPVIIAFVGTQLIDNTVLQPLIYSNSVKSHPLEIFIVLLMAGNIGGILGMLIAIPTYTVLRVFAKEFFYNFRFVQKLTENI